MSNVSSEILEYIRQNAGTSFVEIERIFEQNNFDYKGDMAITSDRYPNLVFWNGWNKQAIDVIDELLYNELILQKPTKAICYYIDGKVLQMPIAQHYRARVSEHWYPIAFSINKREMAYQ